MIIVVSDETSENKDGKMQDPPVSSKGVQLYM